LKKQMKMIKFKIMRVKKSFLSLIIIIPVAIGLYFFLSEKTDRTSYSEFLQKVEEGSVSSVTFSEKDISYELADGTKFVTRNPSSPDLTERLLLSGIEVKNEMDWDEIISLVFDIFFYLVFFGIIFVAFRKFISPNTFKVVRHTKVHFDDIAGMDDLKRHMMQIASYMRKPSEAAAKGIRLPKGILLEGDPGNGKTLFARALAEEAGVNFIPAKATDFESMFMAIGPMKVKLLFKKARKAAPCIVFIDEFDGIGTRRNYSGSAIETENTRIVTAMLNELDGFEPHSGVLVLAATNSRQALDEALIRPGRFDAKYTVPYPDDKTRLALIEMYSKGKQFGSDCRPETLSGKFKGFSAAKIESVLNRAAMLASQKNASEIKMEDINSAINEM